MGPGGAGAGPVELGRHEGGVGAAAVLPDGRVVTGGGDVGRVLVWDPAEPGARPVELGRHEGGVGAAAVLPDGRVVTGGGDVGRVLVWDPAEPGAAPVELGRHEGEGGVGAAAVLPDGRVVTGSGGRVRLRNMQGSSPGTLLACSAYALATRYLPLPVWSSSLYRSRRGRNFMLGCTPKARLTGGLAGDELSRLGYGRFRFGGESGLTGPASAFRNSSHNFPRAPDVVRQF